MDSWSIVIKRGSLEWKNHKRIINITLEPEAQAHGEILDTDRYKEILATKIENEKIKPGKANIVYSAEVSYERYFPIIKKMINPAEFDRFKEEIPVEPEKAVTKILIGKDKYGVVGVNKELSEVLTTFLEDNKWKIEEVTLELFKSKKGKSWDIRQ